MTEVKTPSAEDVKAEEVTTEATPTPEKEEWEFKVSKEEYEKLQELEKNKSIALKQEREQMSEIQKKLAEYQEKERQLEEKEKLKKWKYEEVIAEKDKALAEAQEKAKLYEELQEKLTTEKTQQLDWLLEQVPQELKDKYASIADKLDLDDKIAFYKNIMQDIKKEDFSTNPKKEWADIKADDEDKAKAQGFDAYMRSILTNK